MQTPIRSILTGAGVAAFVVALSGTAFAHGLTVTAEAGCAGGTAVVNFTVTSKSHVLDGSHNRIEVSFNGSVVYTGVFDVSTGNTFSGSATTTASSVVVTATAVGDWVDGTPGGQSASTTLDVPTDCVATGIGRFTGGGHQIEVGGVARVTRGLTIHCDLLLSNNLEINWGGDHFHMSEHLETLSCTDDPLIEQRPPVAPIDTLVGRGTGRYNGVAGYRIDFTLVDAGEPGRLDEMAILITAPDGTVVLNVPRTRLTGGNLQAHYDQPHKR